MGHGYDFRRTGMIRWIRDHGQEVESENVCVVGSMGIEWNNRKGTM